MIETIAAVNQAVNSFIWGIPAMVCIIGVGLLLSVRTGFLQIRKFPYAIRTTVGRMFRKRDASDGAMTPFQAVCTALAGTVGTGNIAGVAGAIAIGGPGAVFWMWCSALLGMCTKFAEVTLAVHFRERSDTGEWVGGPMYYIKNGLGRRWQFLAVLYALFGVLTVFGTGNATQVNTIVAAVDTALLEYGLVGNGFLPTLNLIVGILVAVLVALVLLGCEVLFFAARPGRWKYDFVSVLVCLVLMAGCFCMAMLPMLWDELSGENQQTMNRLSAQAIDELYTACKQDAQDIAIRDISGRLYLNGAKAETLQQAAALPAGDTCLTLTVELFGPYDSAAAFARDCYTLTALAKQCTVPPEKLHFTWDARSPAESSLNTGSLLYTEDYSLDLSGAVQLDWTEQQMEQQTETEYLLDAENIPDEGE